MQNGREPGIGLLLPALVFLSGACGLVYEVVWVRMLVVVFGTSVFAVSTVLSAFMAGLAAGSVLFGRAIDRGGRGLRVYARLEAGIGLFALAFPALLALLDEVHTWLYRGLESRPLAFALARFALCFAVLLVPTTLMGGTLPVLVKAVAPRRDAIGRAVGGLYAINTLGAAIGCAAAAYFLMEWFGTAATTRVAAGANLLVAAGAYALSRRRAPVAPARREPATDPPAPETPGRVGRLVFWGFALSGFAALGYEVAWARLLSLSLRITTLQSVSTILITFLAGLAAGGAAGARLADRWRRLPFAFGVLELLLALLGVLSLLAVAAGPALADALAFLPGWGGHVLRLFAVCCAVILAPTFVMGLLFPIVGRIHVADPARIGSGVGRIYAANTTGAILGAFLTGFVLIPALGTQRAVYVLAALNLATGAAVLLAAPEPRARVRRAVLGTLAVAFAGLLLTLPRAFLERVFAAAQPGSELLFHHEDPAGTVTVHELPRGQRLLRVNGAGEVPTDPPSIRTFRLLGNLPFLVHPDPREAVVVAFGGGITLGAAERHVQQRLDVVEVAPGVLEAAPWFERYNHGVWRRVGSERLQLVVGDGRNHILRTRRRYDVIVSDSTHPATADSWVLYTAEFYGLCARRLESGGVMAQWLPIHGLTVEDYRAILRTFRGAFPHATLWLTKQYSILLGTPEPLRFDLARVEERLDRPGVRADLAEVDLGSAVAVAATLALGEAAFAEFAGAGPLNRDDRPFLSVGDRARSGTASGLPVTMALVPLLGRGLESHVVGAGPVEREALARRVESNRHCFAGDVALRLGDPRRAVEEYRRARAIDPGFGVPARTLQFLEAGGTGEE